MIRGVLLFLLVTQIPLTSLAEDRFYMSGLLGVGTLDDKGTAGDKYDNELTYGLRGGLSFSENFSAGLFFKQMRTRSGAGPETTTKNIMAEATYYLSGRKNNTFWFSGLIGMTQVEESSAFQFTGSNQSGLSYGASAGYQFMVTPHFSLNPQLTYIYTKDAGFSDYSDVSSMLNVNFWF